MGVAVPIAVADLAGHTAWGALAGLGALYAGFASFRGVYRQRIRSIYLTVLATSLMTVAGCLVSQSEIASLVILPAICFIAALYATSSQTANSIATQSVCVLIVLDGLGLGPSTALGNGGLVMFGGLVQILLLTVIWPVNPRFPERKAIADAYGSLATFFEHLPDGDHEMIPGSQRFEEARTVIEEARNFRWRDEHELLVELMRSAETLRAAAVGFGQAAERCQETHDKTIRLLCERLSAAMKQVGAKVLSGKFRDLPNMANALPAELEEDPDLEHWYQLLRDRISDLSHSAPLLQEHPLSGKQEGVGWRKIFSLVTKLPDVSSLRSVALGHAVRYTVAIEAALLVTKLWHESHMYWLPLTVAIVLRPDFATTATRGVSRLSGTLLGITLASAVLSFFQPSPNITSVLTIVTTWFCFALIQPNYALYSIAITVYVVFSVSSAALGHHGLAIVRLLATLGGSTIALLAYILWPSFQGRQLSQVIIDALDAQIAFGERVRDDLHDSEGIDDARNHARQLRIRAESLFQTAALEPWGVSADQLEDAREAILKLDENAAELLASRADLAHEVEEINATLSSSRELRDRLDRKLDQAG